MALLEYENQIFLDAFHEDGLLILARGLGIDRIFVNFLKIYSDPGSLVLVLNTLSTEEDYFIEQLESDGVKPLPRIITNEFKASERQSMYLQGGVLFLTSRILVVDLLTDRVPIDLVTGILVYKANRILESCQESFILRLYRQKNKSGFIKAFSDNPDAFISGFCQVERVMKNLFVRKLFLWPRFHANVVSCLEKHKVDVVELHMQISPAMTACQTALLDLINACVKELKRCTPAVDTDEVTVENALGKSFDKTIRIQLDPVWHQLSTKTRQLVSDLKTLRLILRHLTQYDCVTFYSLVHSIRTNEKTFGQNTGWLFLDAADSLFVHARDRVWRPQEKKKKLKSDKEDAKPVVENQEPVLEECPKWKVLSEILKEIDEENKKCDSNSDRGRVLICAEDDRTCNQLKEYLRDGGKELLLRLYNKFLAVKGGGLREETKENKSKSQHKGKGKLTKPAAPISPELTLTQMMGDHGKSEDVGEVSDGESNLPLSSQDAYFGVLPEPVTILHPLHGCSDPHGLSRTLQEVQPRYIILYDADMQFVRQIEVYRASHPGVSLRVYFLLYSSSVEEQKYLTTLRKEKEAFEYLIKQKATMVIPEERDGKMEDDPNLARGTTPANATTNSRKGAVEKPVQKKIIVDMREFRSELPSLVHRRGIEIEPVTLEVGDYILTPDICVERKSVSDLIGSLNNGRLYNQCVSMSRYYKRPVLLIEFDATKSFSLQGKYSLSNDVSMQDVTSRLALLTLHFPKLRILWCPSPYATAELFDELKAGREQPDATTAMSVTAAETAVDWTDKYSHGPQDFLLRMPGVNSKNYRHLMNKVQDLSELTQLSLERLTEIMGSSGHAKLLFDFLHVKQSDAATAFTGPQQTKTDKKRTFISKRKK
ncbi:DNA repair endonuclease XPF-like isoform X2 [Gigantopelta aegis]|uniref:DNA repair endonuclease XPF-like isoform X2 n=1 Tax=Gigantopelta aegis TaxID=1735272 RepID=UPI001B88DD50|nr:DNA repair endonuclease XPF-like isoform X2 [Gigantopelta aegis]